MQLKEFYIISLFTIMMFLLPNVSLAQPIMFGGIGNGSPINAGSIITINQTNGTGTFVGDPVTPGGLSGIDFNSAGQLFGTTIQSESTSTLVEINPNTGALINTIGTIMNLAGAPMSIGDLAFQPGTDVLYGIRSNTDLTGNGGELYTINTTNGVATLVGDTLIDRACGLGFAPNGTLYCWEGDLHTLDPNTGSILTTQGTSEGFIDALGVRGDGTIFGSRAGSGSVGDDIVTVDPTNGIVTFIGDTGVGTVSDIAFLEVVTPTPIPTLSEWAIIILIIALGLMGLIAVRKRLSIQQ